MENTRLTSDQIKQLKPALGLNEHATYEAVVAAFDTWLHNDDDLIETAPGLYSASEKDKNIYDIIYP